MKKLALAALLAFAATALAADGASAAPSAIPNRMIDLDVKEASVRNVYRLLAQVSKRTVTVDPCVTATVTLRLKNTPLPVVYDVLASKLHLTYEEKNDDSIVVHCKPKDGDDEEDDELVIESLATRVSVSANERPLPDLLDELARSAKLGGVDYRATKRPAITMSLKDVRLGTAVQAVTESSGVHVAVRGDRLVVADGS